METERVVGMGLPQIGQWEITLQMVAGHSR
jgi:hypothetical protein